MKDGCVGQRRFVVHKKIMDFRIIVVCMKYKCQRDLVFQGCCMKILDYWSLGYYRVIVCGGGSCCCEHQGCDDDGYGWRIRLVTS